MRDVIVTLIIFGALPLVFLRPHFGILMWSWIAFMNPHRLTWGFAFDFPFALIVAVVTIAGWVLSQERKKLPLNNVTVLIILIGVWVSVTTITAQVPDLAALYWDRAIKIIAMALLTIVLINDRTRLHQLIWVVVVSIGFWGIKGGFFALRLGGAQMVWGPMNSFMQDNNAMALALIMVLPLMRYLQLRAEAAWVRWGLIGAMGFSCLSIVASYSRGAFLAGAVMMFVLILKSRRRGLILMMATLALVFSLAVVPSKWIDRMATIQTYEQDDSAMGRLDAWEFAYKLALDRPLTGGGFLVNADKALFFKYVPDAPRERAAHSVYFEMLGEHGFVGLALFLALGLAALLCGTRVLRATRNRPDLQWARDLAGMIQVSLIGFAMGGLFQNLAFFDLFYQIAGIAIILRILVEKALAEDLPAEDNVVANALHLAPDRRSI